MKSPVYYVLIIDPTIQDHLCLRKAIAGLLPQAFIESIYNENESMAYFNKLPLSPNLILLDMNMPGNFLKLALYMIRQNPMLKAVPVIIMNAVENQHSRKELKQLGANEFYLNPLNTIELRLMLRDIKHRWLPTH